MGEWKKVKFEEIFSFLSGKAKPQESGIYPIYGSNGIIGSASDFMYENAFIIGRVGAVGELRYCKGKFWASDNTIVAKLCCDYIDEQFSKFLLSSSNLKSEVHGSVQPLITKGGLRLIEAMLPPLATQRKIAAVLGAIDDKIETDRKICANLEAQAQALFKSWFVDFEPFGGKMPSGWKMGKLGDVCKIFDSRRIPLSSLQRAEMQGDIPYYGATSIVDNVNDFLLEGIYLLMGEDGSVITDKGYPFLQYIWGKFWPNNHAHVLQGTNGYTTEMLYCLLSQTKVERYVTGAVQPKISQGNMIMIPACIPEGSDAKKFSGMIQPLFDELRCITDESRALAAMRDALLPKLMSGEIDVSKVEVA